MINLAELTKYGAHSVRCFTPAQFENPEAARRELDGLVEGAFFAKTKLVAVPVLRVELLHTFASHRNDGASERLATELYRRWSRHQPMPLTVYWATKRTVQLLGGCMSGRLPNLDCITHDLGVSALALTLFAMTPALRDAWIPEELFEDVYRQAKPDAALADASGISAYIEFAGRYTRQRLDKLQEFALQSECPLHLYTIADKR